MAASARARKHMVRVRLAQASEVVAAGQRHSWCWLEQAGCGRDIAEAGTVLGHLRRLAVRPTVTKRSPPGKFPTLTSRKLTFAVPGKHGH